MQLGVQYYRDPNPPEKFWRKDLADIARAGMAAIGCWIPWRYINPAPGRWEVAKYRRLFDLAHGNGLKVRVQLVPESAPDWAAREMPDALKINDQGQRIPLHPCGMLQLGGWPGLCWHHPGARERIDEYYRTVVKLLRDHPAILTWDIWNEIGIGPHSFDPYTQDAYRRWARSVYGGIADYNRTHHTRFRSYAEVEMPNERVQGGIVLSQAADFAQFRWDRSVAEAHHRARLVREADPGRPVSLHTAASSPFVIERNDFGVADAGDIYGASTYNIDPFYDTMSAIKQRSIKGPGKWWLTERCGGRMVYYYGHCTFSGRDLVNDALKALAHGASGVCYWQYRCERVEQEAPNFGLLHHDGSRSERLDAVAGLARALARWNPDGMVLDPAVVGMVVEPFDLVFRTASESWMRQLWQEEKEFEEWLRALLYAGHSPNLVNAQSLGAAPPPDSLKVLIAPSLVILRPGVAETLSRWVRRGGHLIVGPFTGVFNLRGEAFDVAPGDGLAKLFGLRVFERANGGRFPFAPGRKGAEELAGRHLFEHVRVDRGTEVLLWCEGSPAVLRRSAGKGTATYVTSFAGADQSEGGSLLVPWVREYLARLGVRPPAAVGGPVWINTARLGRQRVVFIHNPGAEPCVATLTVPPHAAAGDPIADTTLKRRGGCISFRLAPREVRVAAVESSGQSREVDGE
jgi:beta-galactosidase